MSGVIDLTQEDDHAADTEEDEPAQTADVAGGAAAQPVLTGVAFWQHGPCCGDRCRSCLRCAATAPCHQREPCLCEEAGEQGGRPEEELRRLQQAREEALYKQAIASSLAPAPPSESPADERAYNAQLAEAMRQSVEEARLRQSAEETHWRQTLDASRSVQPGVAATLAAAAAAARPNSPVGMKRPNSPVGDRCTSIAHCRQ